LEAAIAVTPTRASRGQLGSSRRAPDHWAGAGPYATPATNRDIAEEVFLSVDAVKTHLRTLFGKFGVEDLPQNQKRVKLVEFALQSGTVTPRDLS